MLFGRKKITTMHSFIITVGYLIDTSTREGDDFAKKIHAHAIETLQKENAAFAKNCKIVKAKNIPHKFRFARIDSENEQVDFPARNAV